MVLQTKIICKLSELVPIKGRTIIRLENVRHTISGKNAIKRRKDRFRRTSGDLEELQGILGNHHSLLEYNLSAHLLPRTIRQSGHFQRFSGGFSVPT